MEIINDKLFNWASMLNVNARLQAERTARMPFVERVALMPDAHVGMGATVGSVIGTNGAIMPSAVGVDIGCVDADTEYLSPQGWRRIADYDGDPVMIYDLDSNTARFETPSRYIDREQQSFLHFKTKYGIDQMLTSDHRVLIWKITGRDRRREPTVINAGELAAKHNELTQGFKGEFKTTFEPILDTKIDLSDNEIRVQVMVNADAWLDGSKAVLRLKKSRKINRAKNLLHSASITFTERFENDTIILRFTPPLPVKSYTPFWACSAAQLSVITDEVIHWDDNEADRCFYTRDRESADFIQYAFTASGYRSVMREDVHPRDGKIDFRVYAHDNTMVGLAGTPKTPITEIESVDGRSYCFIVSTGFWIMRRSGNVVITGNCGMAAVSWHMKATDLPDDLDKFMPEVSRSIPAGVGQGHSKISKESEKWWMTNRDRFRTHIDDKLRARALQQFGSLGSGNHFFEICLDENDFVWFVLHSGSRGLGNIVATRHIKEAKELAKRENRKLEDTDLAYFLEHDTGFTAYIEDMLACQDYAAANRMKMLDSVIRAWIDFMSDRGFPAIQGNVINCHHNFTQLEEHAGKKVWVTRKGAIRAREGDLGIIPGSMGAQSYIVEGLGNTDSYCSCSHGAGRVHSRSAAKKLYDAEDLHTAMEGKIWNSDRADALVDEIPMSYKPIDVVMEDQKDLVKPLHTLRQILNYKGT